MADCLAGVWTDHATGPASWCLDAGRHREALDAAAAGDDRILATWAVSTRELDMDRPASDVVHDGMDSGTSDACDTPAGGN
jgi:predicted metalloprotease